MLFGKIWNFCKKTIDNGKLAPLGWYEAVASFIAGFAQILWVVMERCQEKERLIKKS